MNKRLSEKAQSLSLEIEKRNRTEKIYVDEKDANGQVAHWSFEAGGSPSILIRRGFTKAAVPVGAEVVVDGYRAKDGSTRGSATNLTFPDGRKLFVGSTNPVESGPAAGAGDKSQSDPK